jgi:hypothetical protein
MTNKEQCRTSLAIWLMHGLNCLQSVNEDIQKTESTIPWQALIRRGYVHKISYNEPCVLTDKGMRLLIKRKELNIMDKKKQYTVCISRDISEQCVVTVDASDAHEAVALAYEKSETDEAEWSTSDWCGDSTATIMQN